MNLPQPVKTVLLVVVCAASLCALVFSMMRGADTDKDPYAKVEAPGYYNGPMKPRGKPWMPAAGGIKGETKPVGSN